MRRKKDETVFVVRKWFQEKVKYEGEAYVLDEEQIAAVIDESFNTIVVARAGSGKTRTIVAKIVYLIAMKGVKPEEVMAFVFNANAAREINDRLGRMEVDGEVVIKGEVKIAQTFHAFSRAIVYEACGGRGKCGKILAGEKEEFVFKMIEGMMKKEKWFRKIVQFIGGESDEDSNKKRIEERELKHFSGMMAQFINRAQQQFLGGEEGFNSVVERYLEEEEVEGRERLFIELGTECFRRYHWLLLEAPIGLKGFEEYGTDFNLIVSWASKLIKTRRGEAALWLRNKKYILIDEYQDFSQLFLGAVKAIRKVSPEARLFVVGDDWQAINRFAGSEVSYFKGFGRYFKDARRYEITTNYRCERMIVETARGFMKRAMREKGEFRAKSRRMGRVMMINPRETECEVPLVEYDRRVSGKDRIFCEMGKMLVGGSVAKIFLVRYLKMLMMIIKKNRKAGNILILHRNNEMNMEGVRLEKLLRVLKWGIVRLKIMTEEEFNTKIEIMTMHKSKGLEAEVVIILEADTGVIPKTHPDTRLYRLFGETEAIALADQKRLFYVAMTRAKRRLYIIHDPRSGEGFMKYLGGTLEY